MKTTEEKAKAYDEAIAHAKLLLKTIGNSTLGNLVLKNEFENMFPELKEESEDERIRKALIQIFNVENFENYDIKNEEVIAWLGKKSEQEQNPCEHCKDKCLNCYNFPCIDKREFEQGKSALEAIKEEKVDNANKAEQKFKAGDTIKNPTTGIIVTISEVDTKNKEYKLSNSSFIPFKYEESWVTVEDELNHTLSEESKEGMYSNKEWNEEDEEYLESILEIINNTPALTPGEIECHKDWLKSLRPQNLKLNEEQALNRSANRMRHEIINYLSNQSIEDSTRKEKHDKWINWLISLGEAPKPKKAGSYWIECVDDALSFAEEKGYLTYGEYEYYSSILYAIKHQDQ